MRVTAESSFIPALYACGTIPEDTPSNSSHSRQQVTTGRRGHLDHTKSHGVQVPPHQEHKQEKRFVVPGVITFLCLL